MSFLPIALLASSLLPGQQATPRFEAELPEGVERPWIGPGFHGNRLQDWRLAGGRIECVEGSARKPCRVLHALTAAVGGGGDALDLSLRVAPLDAGSLPGEETWAGFLVGAGGPEIDHRLTALVHHRPAEDGGLLAVVDGDGRAVFRDFERNVRKGNWGITGELDEGECLPLEGQEQRGEGFGEQRPAALRLELSARRGEAGWRLTLVARDDATGAELSRSTLAGLATRRVDGSLAIVSHRGPEGSARGWWFDDWRAEGDALEIHPERTFGPYWTAQYTLSSGTLKLTAQLPPLGPDREQRATLELRGEDGEWRPAAEGVLERPSNTIAFRVEGFASQVPVPYRLRTRLPSAGGEREYRWSGTIRPEPEEGLVLAAFTGNKHFTGGIRWNHGGVWFPHTDIVEAVRAHDPDLLFFSGDQIYEGDLTGAQRRPLETAYLDYHDHWLRWCWAFRELVRDRPTICIPDDHDVYHGNLWGAGGRAAKRQDDGGYTMPAAFVRMVERTQTSHLPDPADPRPVEQGIGTYFTDLRYGGVSFAILEDRKFKSSATSLVPEGKVVNGWFQNRDFDPREADVPGAVLLGERQLAFLRDWAADWSDGVWMKCALSQTIFANVATIPAAANSGAVLPSLEHPEPGDYPEGDRLAADCDSNGWPQSGRDRALRELRRAFAFHVAGDQHLASFVRYGVDAWDDAGYAFCVPSIANTWPRRWYPPMEGEGREPGSPRYTGRFLDGFGNPVTVHAVSNPVRSGREPAALHDRAPGYGIVRFDRATREITVECWPRGVDPLETGARQYPGWPRVLRQADNYAREPVGYLRPIEVVGAQTPVVQVVEKTSGDVIYTLRLDGPHFRAPVFSKERHTLRVGDGDEWTILEDLSATSDAQPLRIGGP